MKSGHTFPTFFINMWLILAESDILTLNIVFNEFYEVESRLVWVGW